MSLFLFVYYLLARFARALNNTQKRALLDPLLAHSSIAAFLSSTKNTPKINMLSSAEIKSGLSTFSMIASRYSTKELASLMTICRFRAST
jgi:hypothetical protein